MPRSAIIVGAGPAGALLAYILVSRGIPVTLIERHSDFAREFRGEGMMPSGQRMLRDLGLWEPFNALPHVKLERAAFYFKGVKLAERKLAFEGDMPPRFVSQPALLDMLVGLSALHPGFTFEDGARVTGLVRQAGRVTGVRIAGKDRDREIAGDYVFGCDGRFSMLRQDAGLDKPRTPEAFDVVWCKLAMPPAMQGVPRTVRGYVGGGHLGLFIPSYDGLLQVGWIIPKGSYRDFRQRGVAGWLDEMAEHVSADLADHLRAHRNDPIRPFLLDVVCDCYPEWTVPGMLLVGDAAHPMSPVGAQGINIALRDAVVAANHFVPPLLAGADAAVLDAAAESYQSERRTEVEPIQAAQRRLPPLLFSNGVAIHALAGAVWLLSRVLPGHLLSKLLPGPRSVFLHGLADVRLQV